MSLFSNLFGGEFGKGLVAGTAKGLEKGFADDIERTKNNVDNLVIESYKGAVESKKEFDRVYKENRKIVDQIIANLGGEQGADNPEAIVAAQGLIADQGLDRALKYSQNLVNAFNFDGTPPIKNLQMGKRTNHSTPLTADLLTKSTVPAITIPNFKDLTKTADVGIMRFFGDEDYTSNEVESRASALMRARGIDPNKGDLNLPPAVSVKVDPLIMGMQSDPTNEIIRLQNFIEKNPNMDKETQARVKNMLTSQHNILNRVRSIKEKRLPGPLTTSENKEYRKFITTEIVNKFNIDAKLKGEFSGEYVTIGQKNQKRGLVTDYVNDIMVILGDAAKKGILSKEVNFFTTLSKAIRANKKIVAINDVLTTVDDQDLFKKEDYDVLEKKGSRLPPPGGGNLSTMSQSQLVSSIKSLQPNTPKRTKAMNELVKLIINNRKAQGTPVGYNDAMNIAKNLVK